MRDELEHFCLRFKNYVVIITQVKILLTKVKWNRFHSLRNLQPFVINKYETLPNICPQSLVQIILHDSSYYEFP
jgi:hypothetical protein